MPVFRFRHRKTGREATVDTSNQPAHEGLVRYRLVQGIAPHVCTRGNFDRYYELIPNAGKTGKEGQ